MGKRKLKFGLALGSVFSESCSTIQSGFLMDYLDNMGIKSAWVYLFLYLGSAFGQIMSTKLSDMFPNWVGARKFGPIKVLHLIGSILCGIAFNCLFTGVHWSFSNVAKTELFCILAFVYSCGMSGSSVCSQSLINKMLKLQKEKSKCHNYRFFIYVIVTVLIFGASKLMMFVMKADGVSENAITEQLAHIVSGITCVFVIINFSLVNENQSELNQIEMPTDTNKNTKTWKTDIISVVVVILFVSCKLFLSLTLNFAKKYVDYVLLQKDNYPFYMIVLYAGNFSLSALNMKLSNRIECTITLAMSALIGLAASTWIMLGPTELQFYVVAFMIGIAQCGFIVSANSLLSSFLSGYERASTKIGYFSAGDKVLNGITIYLIKLMAPEIPETPNTVEREEAKVFYCCVMSLVTFIPAGIAFLTSTYVHLFSELAQLTSV